MRRVDGRVWALVMLAAGVVLTAAGIAMRIVLVETEWGYSLVDEEDGGLGWKYHLLTSADSVLTPFGVALVAGGLVALIVLSGLGAPRDGFEPGVRPGVPDVPLERAGPAGTEPAAPRPGDSGRDDSVYRRPS